MLSTVRTALRALIFIGFALAASMASAQSATPVPLPERFDRLEEAVRSLEKQVTELLALLRSALPPSPISNIDVVGIDVAKSPAKGSPTAKVILIEYSDFECPFCAQHAKTVYPALQKQFVETGKIRYVFRHLPLERLHPLARKAAEAAECARDQGKFWEFHDRLFANQKALALPDLTNHARFEGLNLPAFQSCLVEGRTSARVEEDLAEAAKLGLTGTPAFLLGEVQPDGRVRVTRKVTGALPLPAFQATIESFLAGSAKE